MRVKLTQAEVHTAAHALASNLSVGGPKVLYGIPRGGIPAAYLVAYFIGESCRVTFEPKEATHYIDDLIDSGKTSERWSNKPFFALYDKRTDPILKDKWLIFPWESDEVGSGEDIFLRLLQFIGEDVKRQGLEETPSRALKAWKEWTSGYSQKPEEILKVFTDGAENYDEMVTVKDIPFYSHCEHHLAPFFGTATISYIPKGKIVGLSKLNRLVEIFSKRLQVQERMTAQIADILYSELQPLGVGVTLKGRHLCTESRGVKHVGHITQTNALRGVFRTQSETRAEFLSL